MRLLVSGSSKTVRGLADRYPDHLGHLLVPSAGNRVETMLKTGLLWGADNGAFSGLDPVAFRSMLSRISGKPRCLFIVCPDAVADAKRTIDLFDQWREEVARHGPVAFVGQDGQENLETPWQGFAAFFIGGSTAWKLSAAAADLAREAKRLGKWVHMGRVNSKRRLQHAWEIGCDSVDGSSASRWGDKYIHKYLRWIREIEAQQLLPFGSVECGLNTI